MPIENQENLVHRKCLSLIDIDNYAKSTIKFLEKGCQDFSEEIPAKIKSGDFYFIYSNFYNGIGISNAYIYLPRSTSIEYGEGRVDPSNPFMVSNICSFSGNTPNIMFMLKAFVNGDIKPGINIHKEAQKIKNEDEIPGISIQCYEYVDNYLEVLTRGNTNQTLFLYNKDIEMLKNIDFSELFDLYEKIEWKTMREKFEMLEEIDGL